MRHGSSQMMRGFEESTSFFGRSLLRGKLVVSRLFQTTCDPPVATSRGFDRISGCRQPNPHTLRTPPGLISFISWVQSTHPAVALTASPQCFNPYLRSGVISGSLAGLLSPQILAGCIPQANFYPLLNQVMGFERPKLALLSCGKNDMTSNAVIDMDRIRVCCLAFCSLHDGSKSPYPEKGFLFRSCDGRLFRYHHSSTCRRPMPCVENSCVSAAAFLDI